VKNNLSLYNVVPLLLISLLNMWQKNREDAWEFQAGPIADNWDNATFN